MWQKSHSCIHLGSCRPRKSPTDSGEEAKKIRSETLFSGAVSILPRPLSVNTPRNAIYNCARDFALSQEMAGRDVRSATSPDLPLRLWPCHDLAEHRIRTVSSSCRGPDVIAAASAVQIRHLDIASDDSEEDKTLLQHHTNTVVSVPVVRSVVVAVRTTKVVRFVVPGAAPQNAERPRAIDPSPSAQTHGGVIAEPALCSDRFTNASLSESTNPRIFKLARRAAPVAEIENRRNRIRVTEDRGPEDRATATSASESQRNDSEEDKTLLQHHTNTEASLPGDRRVEVAGRTTNEERRVEPGAAPHNAVRPRVGPRGIGSG